MLSEDGRFAITYNGEVYNYRELASSLGLTDLHSTCDTEVVLRSFAQIGSSAFRQLNGMFAFALHDVDDHRRLPVLEGGELLPTRNRQQRIP